ncbi:N-acetylmuramoyl-L-alanine amidase [bacterium]|nr:N-acetylmuramoyl-L-alanine amidase [bacterium]
MIFIRSISPSFLKAFLTLIFLVSICFFQPSFIVAGTSQSKLKTYTFDNNQKFRVGFDGTTIRAQLRPRPGDGEYRFASWTLRDWKNNFNSIKTYNKNRPLKAYHYVEIPFSALNDVVQSMVLQTLFENDNSEEEGWAHRVIFSGETISFIAGVFAKNEISAQKLVSYNKLSHEGRLLKKGDVVMIPWNWVKPELSLKPVSVRKPLYIKKDRYGKPYAYYRIQKGESLYSAVVIRFTGRTLAEDVNQMAGELLKLNAIADERHVFVDLELKIPLEWISEDYLVQISKATEPPELKPPVRKRPQKGLAVHVIIDPGHGGHDPGAVFGSAGKGNQMFEDETVYDISLRLEKILKDRNYLVHSTLQDPNQLHPIQTLASLKDNDEIILVNPHYNALSSSIGVNMRVFLVNDIYRQLIRKKVPKENILLMSIHGDALHPSLSGLSVYYPDQRLRMASFNLKSKVYRRRKEYQPKIQYGEWESKHASQLSSAFGRLLVSDFRKAAMQTHSSSAVRGYYYRKGKRTLPAILRYSKIPTSILVEVGNLNNETDREALQKDTFRQQMASALAASIHNHFQGN